MLKLLFFAVILVDVYSANVQQAVVVLKTDQIDGKITFTKTTDGIKIEGTVSGLSEGLHGFHVHEKGELGNNCTDAGGHFNPKGKDHGAPTDENRHVGDLGNIEANNKNIATVNILDNVISFEGENRIIGRALVIHSDEDDLGKGNYSDSKTTGHAGARLVCGVIGDGRSSSTRPGVYILIIGSNFLLLTILSFFGIYGIC